MTTWRYEKILTPGGSEKRLGVADEDDLCATRQGRLGSGPESLDRLHPSGPQRR